MGEKGLSAKEEAFMLQELKMKSLKGHAASIIIALALAAGLLWGTGFGAFKAIGGPKPLDSLDVSELKGQYVEAEVYLIYDWYACALPGFVDSKNEEKTERNAGYLVVSHSGGGMLRQGTRKGIRRTPANRGMRAHWVVKGLDISEDVCHGMCP